MAEKVLADARIQLKDGLTPTVIKQLLDDLREEKVLNEEEADSILEENLSRADKARNLIDSVRKKGSTASDIMLAKLKINDKQLYGNLKLDERLGSACGGPAPGASTGQSCTESDQGSDMEYTMTSKPRGFCLIINNMKFKNPKKNRPGSNYDEDDLKKVFEFLGFAVHCYQDQTAVEMKKLMLKYSKKEGHRDCFVCCVLSHGGTNGVDGVDSKPCPMEDIFSPFDGKNCPSLVGKPKVFIIQACRGSEREEKILVSDNAGSDVTSDAPKESYSIPKNSDFLVAMSTVQNFVSYRSDVGSWFIKSLCKHLKKGSESGEDILTILTSVNNEVSGMDGKEIVNEMVCDAKMTPQPNFTLRKKLIFRIPVSPQRYGFK